MRFQTTLEGAECLRRSDAGWQVFQARGAATKNARSPIVVRYEDCVTRADVVFGVVLIVIIIVIYVAYTGQIKTDKVNNI